MSISVTTCRTCGARYNASQYPQCPYCAGGVTLNKKKKGGFLGRKKNEAEQAAVSQDMPTQAIPGGWQPQQGYQQGYPGGYPQGYPQQQPQGWSPQQGQQPPQRPWQPQAAQQPQQGWQDDSPATTVLDLDLGATTVLNVEDEIAATTVLEVPKPQAEEPKPEEAEAAPQEAEGETPDQGAKAPDWAIPETENVLPEKPGEPPAQPEPEPPVTPPTADETVYPVVGWLVCVRGVYYGRSFPLRSGVSRIARSADVEVPLTADSSVSRTPVARIVYDTRSNGFSLIPGDSGSLCYVGGEAVYERMTLQGLEEIELGDSGKNQFVFLPLCGPGFQWSRYPRAD